jgi:hypothetical protein
MMTSFYPRLINLHRYLKACGTLISDEIISRRQSPKQ